MALWLILGIPSSDFCMNAGDRMSLLGDFDLCVLAGRIWYCLNIEFIFK